MANIFYISLTGMTEPLGRSQVLEYLIDLSRENEIYLLSFERENDLENVDEIKELIKDHDIQWHYMTYSNKYGVASTVWQILKAIRLGSIIIKEHSIDIVHARSMIPATIGLLLKKMHGVKLLFDIRGFAIDEKVDSGRLQKSSLFYKVLKKLDNHLYKVSDHIVTLTYAAKEILYKSLGIPEEKITVIPTCANKEVFKLMGEEEKTAFKSALGYAEKDKIVIHTGTVSGWYDFESEVKLVKEMMRQDKDVHFLVLNKHEQHFIQKMISEHQLPLERVKISSSTFDEVYKYLNIADASLFFIKPSYSKQASAPTKFAENVACRLPSITNGNVGDMGLYFEQYSVGLLIDMKMLDRNIVDYAQKGIDYITYLQIDVNCYTSLLDDHFEKSIAISRYQNIYNEIGR